MIAFWKYDLFPGYLSGKVAKVDGERVFVESYQSWFVPVLVLPDAEGEVIAEKLSILARQRKAAADRINGKYQDLVCSLSEQFK